MTVKAPRRRATSQQTRARLLASAKALFLSDGYESTSVRAIADAAGVTIGAFYGHFMSKRNVLFEVVLSMNSVGASGGPPFPGTSERALVLTVASFANTDSRAAEALESVLQVIAPAGKRGAISPAAAGALLTDLVTGPACKGRELADTTGRMGP